jgi:glycosyltransferase involved in cell wall biosynthesis
LAGKAVKIVHIIIGLNVGGAELMLKRLIESHSNQINVEHTVISLTDHGVLGEQLSSQGVVVYCLGMRSITKVPIAFFKLRRLINQLKPDVVQTWMYHSDFIGGLAAKSLGINKIYWNVRNTKLSGRGFGNFIFRKSCAFFSYFIPKNIIYVSNSAKDEHVSAGYVKSKSVVINNGFDVQYFSFQKSSRDKIRNEWGVAENDFLVCSIGRYADAKDHVTFIKSLKIAMSKKNNIFAVIVGKDIPGNKYLLEEIGRFNDRFILLNSRNDIPAVLSACDLFCLHSITEGFPNVLGEAMSVGLPCITTRAGDAELILNNKKLTCDVGNSHDIAEKIVEVSEMALADLKELGEANRNRVVNNYSLSSVVDKYTGLYNS